MPLLGRVRAPRSMADDLDDNACMPANTSAPALSRSGARPGFPMAPSGLHDVSALRDLQCVNAKLVTIWKSGVG